MGEIFISASTALPKAKKNIGDSLSSILPAAMEPKDLIATIFHCLGRGPETTIHDLQSRPLSLSHGRIIEAIV
jgi:hypothetical protein